MDDVFARLHKASPKIAEPHEEQQVKSHHPDNKVCPICGLSFKGDRGLGTHIAKKHPREANNSTLRGIIKNAIGPKNGEGELPKIKEDIAVWSATFKNLLAQDSPNIPDFDEAIGKFLIFLKNINAELPGPQHPAVKFYKMKEKNKTTMLDKGAGQVSNPQRANKADRSRRQEQYQYELAQYNYYNKRKKVVQNIMNADAPKQCPIKMAKIEKHYKELFETANLCTRADYEKCAPMPNLVSIEIETVKKAIKSTSLDTSPGPDGVLIRTIKYFDVSHIIKTITEIMLKVAYVPEPLRQGRTILIYKGKGDMNNISTWRPITIYSIVRRIIFWTTN